MTGVRKWIELSWPRIDHIRVVDTVLNFVAMLTAWLRDGYED